MHQALRVSVLRRPLVVAGVLSTLLLVPVTNASATCGWTVVSSPGSGWSSALQDVAARSGSDAWAVGSFTSAHGALSQPLIQRWNGTVWTTVPAQASGLSDSLSGVTAVSSTDAWAVGSSASTHPGASTTLTEHWDGTTWSIVPSPNPSPKFNDLTSVAAVSADDVWAVGWFRNNALSIPEDQALTEHWDGTSWTVVPSPSLGTVRSVLNRVLVAGHKVWTVGWISDQPTETRIQRWNGKAWKVIASPSPGLDTSSLEDAAAVRGNDIWAVGWSADGFPAPAQTLIEHWDGSTWSQVPSPNPGTTNDYLFGIAAISATESLAVGSQYGGVTDPSLRLRWDGSSWDQDGAPAPSIGVPLTLDAVPGTTQAWAVGSQPITAGRTATLIERYC